MLCVCLWPSCLHFLSLITFSSEQNLTAFAHMRRVSVHRVAQQRGIETCRESIERTLETHARQHISCTGSIFHIMENNFSQRECAWSV